MLFLKDCYDYRRYGSGIFYYLLIIYLILITIQWLQDLEK